METHRCRSREDYFALVNSPQLAVRWMIEQHLATRHAGETSFTLPGFCTACTRAVDLWASFDGAWETPEGLRVPNWRECLACPECGMSGRQRIVSHLVTEETHALRARPDARVYMMEQISPLYRWTRATFPWLDVVGSEFLEGDVDPQVAREPLRHEDAHDLTFADASLDLVVSCDVLEHVADPRRALGEIVRVLRPGGRALLTFPMDPHLDHNQIRARADGDQIDLVLPAVYHGNPLSEQGALVFTDFGWEVLSHMHAAGLDDPSLTVYWSYELGYLGSQFYFEGARRPAAA